MRDDRLRQRGGKRIDGVEFTFTKDKWKHLGEATLVNRVKSHVDVGERWYPEILAQVRAEQAAAEAEAEAEAERVVKADVSRTGEQVGGVTERPQGIRAH